MKFDSPHRRRVLELVAPYRLQLVAAGIAALFSGLFEAAFLVIATKAAIGVADGSTTMSWLWWSSVDIQWMLAVALGCLALRLLTSLMLAQLLTRLATDVLVKTRRRASNAFLHAAWSVQQAEPPGRLQQLVAGFATSSSNVISSVGSMIGASVSLAVLLLAALLVDPMATAAVVVALVVLMAVMAPIRTRIRTYSNKLNRAQGEFSSAIAELGSMGLEMQTFGVRDEFSSRIDELSRVEAVARTRADLTRATLTPVYTALAYTALVFGLLVVTTTELANIPALGAVMLVMLRSLGYGQQIQVASGALQASLPALDEVDRMVDRFAAAPAPEGNRVPSGPGSIQFEKVCFSYGRTESVLTDLTLQIRPGEAVGVVGPSGAGKSTLVQLLLGLREPSSGSISIAGTNLTDVDRAWWSDRVAFVAQEPLMLTGTIEDNVRFFRRRVTADEIELAIDDSGLRAVVDGLRQGIRTSIGPRGSELSGGQRQRLSIARALAGHPELLILDEPTSALDVESEALVRSALARLRGEITIVVIAHRVSTLEICDRILVLEAGRKTAFEPPSALMARNGFYQRAIELSGLE